MRRRCHRSEVPIKNQLASIGFEHGVDFVFHLHNPDNVAELVDVLNPLGAIALTWPASSAAMAKLDGMAMFLKRLSIRYTLMFTRLAHDVRPELQGKILTNVAQLIDDEKISSILTKQMSWKEVAHAHDLQESGTMCGKVAMTIG
jgi:NADPH:quinone reductase-like Zn-dependent oxidoreductase